MVLKLALDKLGERAAAIVAALSVCLWLGALARERYVVSIFTDDRVQTTQTELAAAASRFHNSARLQAQLATVKLSHALEDDESLAQAETAALKAVNLSPHNVNFRLLLAGTQGVSGELAAQEEHLRAAVALAPHYPHVHWQLANLLVRARKTEQSLAEFRQAVTAQPTLLPSALELLWEVSGGKINTLSQAAGETPKNRLLLAQFLFQQGHTEEATQIFRQIAKPARLAAPESAELLSSLLAGGQPELARRLWDDMLGQRGNAQQLVWNGSFEAERVPGLAHFDWQLSRSEYAFTTIDPTLARTGARALRLDFYGRDTTKLADEVKQLLVLQPGAHYRLECYAKAARLVTPEGPRLVVRNRATGQVVAVTSPVSAEAKDWQRLAVDFSAPAGQTTFWVALQRTPKFSYDEPTQGTIWFDDCTLVEVSNTQAY
jgi:tetratricopeptide (TPR) repeat protein